MDKRSDGDWFDIPQYASLRDLFWQSATAWHEDIIARICRIKIDSVAVYLEGWWLRPLFVLRLHVYAGLVSKLACPRLFDQGLQNGCRRPPRDAPCSIRCQGTKTHPRATDKGLNSDRTEEMGRLHRGFMAFRGLRCQG